MERIFNFSAGPAALPLRISATGGCQSSPRTAPPVRRITRSTRRPPGGARPASLKGRHRH